MKIKFANLPDKRGILKLMNPQQGGPCSRMDKQGLDSVMTIHYCTVVYSDNTGMAMSKVEPYILLMIHDVTL